MDSNPISLVSTLLETGNVDTVYRDVYVGRARTLLGPVLSIEEFHHLERERAALAELPLAIARALEKANWPLVKDLSGRSEALQQAMKGKDKLVATARGVYDVTDVRLDPFSPGLQPFTRVPTKSLPALGTGTVEQLATLEAADPPWKDFYTGRRAAFEARVPIISEQLSATAGVTSAVDARAAAAQALKAGDMRRLEQLADALMAAEPRKSEAAHGATAAAAGTQEQAGQDLLAPYSTDTLTRARQLGLAPRHLESKVELASLRRYAWTPLWMNRGTRSSRRRCLLALPRAFGDAWKCS